MNALAPELAWLALAWAWGAVQLGLAWLPKALDSLQETAPWCALVRKLGTSYALACFGWGLTWGAPPVAGVGAMFGAAGLWLGVGFTCAFALAHPSRAEAGASSARWPWAIGAGAAVVQAAFWQSGSEQALAFSAALLCAGAGLLGLLAARTAWAVGRHELNALAWGTIGLALTCFGVGLWEWAGVTRGQVGPAHGQALLLPHVALLQTLLILNAARQQFQGALGVLDSQASTVLQQTEQLRRAESELFRVQTELSTKQQLAAVGELAAAIAHEVRNPLAVIVNAVSGLRRADLASHERGMLLDIVEEEAGRLNRLVTDLLRFARPVNVRRAPVSLADLANRCRATLKDRFDVEVRVADDPSVTTVDVDPNLFRLVFDNLVANACQAMSLGGTVEVQVDPTELNGNPAARIEIRDQGHGMEPQVLERALDPFFTTRPSGTGLGLPIVQRIVDAHGGQLELDSVEGKGTRVILIVPVHAPEAAAVDA